MSLLEILLVSVGDIACLYWRVCLSLLEILLVSVGDIAFQTAVVSKTLILDTRSFKSDIYKYKARNDITINNIKSRSSSNRGSVV